MKQDRSASREQLVMDIGMHDGSDTAYYLSLGYRVVAVEANPLLVAGCSKRFEAEVASAQLTIVNAAISDQSGTAPFYIPEDDAGSATLDIERVKNREPQPPISVDTIPFPPLLHKHGVPVYLKCDIEGSDRYCILTLDEHHRPSYVSFEMGSDALELIDHLAKIGYCHFKIINMLDFCELSYFDSLRHRIRNKIRRLRRLPPPSTIHLTGYTFISEHSSGPMGERTAGKWRSYKETTERWVTFCETHEPARRGGWWDLHARLESG